ncbi:MAG: RteC domain-containing protein [Prevotella sp.]|nr:RteC domain-containing protein [Prevotella sp.]
MTYSILTDTDFFRDLESGNTADIRTDYDKFIELAVCECKKAVSKADMNIMLAYTEADLTMFQERKDETGVYAAKATMLLKELQEMTDELMKDSLNNGPALPQVKWTGQTTELLELAYALKESECVNNGELPIGKMCDAIFMLFGKKPIKDYARIYVAIKERETDYSYTYFIDKMRRKLNDKIKADIRKSLDR